MAFRLKETQFMKKYNTSKEVLDEGSGRSVSKGFLR